MNTQFPQLTPPQQLFRTTETRPLPNLQHLQQTAQPRQAPILDSYRLSPLPTGHPLLTQPLFEDPAPAKPAAAPVPQATVTPTLRPDEIAEGVSYSDHLRTRDGGVVRVLTVDPRRAEIVPVFRPKPGPMSSREVTEREDIVGAINASFFGKGLVGDVLADAKHLFRDNWDARLDSITDQRYFMGVTKDGKTITGKGGIDENNQPQFKHFIGGFPALFTADNVHRLEQDIRSGSFADRADYSGASQNSTISRSFMGVNARGEILLVAAGEGNQRSRGVSMAEGARLLKEMGAVEAYILDGGGSTTLYARGKDFAPTDGRKVWSYIGIRSK